jgi:hypothetical protein
LNFLKTERNKYSKYETVYIIQDGLSAHWTEEIRTWAIQSNTILVPTPTQASWLNPIECFARDIQKMAMDGTDYHDWQEVRRAFQRAIVYRNRERSGKEAIWGCKYSDGRSKLRRPIWKRH